jgi:uncharacterized damage-inducible protein DinB
MKELLVRPLEGYEPLIATWLSAMEEARQRTIGALEGLTDEIINWSGSRGVNSIGSLLYHIAAIEMSWLYEDILEGEEFSPQIAAWMQYDVRGDDGSLTSVTSEPLETHLNRLRFSRDHFLTRFKGMSVMEFRRPRKLEDYEVTPEWVIHHLMQHEAEHRGQIGEVRSQAEHALGKAY